MSAVPASRSLKSQHPSHPQGTRRTCPGRMARTLVVVVVVVVVVAGCV